MRPNPIAIWAKAARVPFFTGSLIPITVGVAVAYCHTHHVDWGLGLLTLLGMVLLHASANMSNDYFDHLSGDDSGNQEFAAPFTGGSRAIQEGLVSPRAELAAALLCLTIGGLIGLYLYSVRGPMILLLGFIGGAGGFFYTAPPLKFAYRGFGELFIGLNFGLLPTLGAYFVQTGHLSGAAAVASIPVALLIIAILWINQFQDMNADAAVGKRNLVVRMGRKRASVVYAVMMLATYAFVIIGVATGFLPRLALISLLSLPIALAAVRTALRYYNNIPVLTPANAGTIAAHFATGVLLTVGIALGHAV